MNGVRLNCEAFEARDVPAKIDFINGHLIITVQNSDYAANRGASYVGLSVDYRTYGSSPDSQVLGRLRVNGRPIPVFARDVTRITVNGTDNKDNIDLSGVVSNNGAAWSFRGLDGKVQINGRGGDDLLGGSGSFSTVFVGGGGRDRFIGGKATNDQVLDWQQGHDFNYVYVDVVNGRRV